MRRVARRGRTRPRSINGGQGDCGDGSTSAGPRGCARIVLAMHDDDDDDARRPCAATSGRHLICTPSRCLSRAGWRRRATLPRRRRSVSGKLAATSVYLTRRGPAAVGVVGSSPRNDVNYVVDDVRGCVTTSLQHNSVVQSR